MDLVDSGMDKTLNNSTVKILQYTSEVYIVLLSQQEIFESVFARSITFIINVFSKSFMII